MRPGGATPEVRLVWLTGGCHVGSGFDGCLASERSRVLLAEQLKTLFHHGTSDFGGDSGAQCSSDCGS